MRKLSWWHGVLFFAAVQGAAFGVQRAVALHAKRRPAGDDGGDADREYYRSSRLPIFAPPPAAFPIAWTINTACAIAGDIRVLNLPEGAPGKAEYLRRQAGAWFVYVLFNAGYFALRSPLNAAVLTAAYTAFTLGSVDVAARTLRDQRVVASLVPTVLWLAVANPLAVLQAAWNEDDFWKVGPLFEPPPNLLKRRASS